MSAFWRRRIPFLVILLLLAPLVYRAWRREAEELASIPCSGGTAFQGFKPFAAVHYSQVDARWKDERVGGSEEELGRVGCTVASACIAMSCFGEEWMPGALNRYLREHDGYTRQGMLKWAALTTASGGRLEVDVKAKPALADLDAALQARQPALAKILIHGSVPHWVVVVGKQGLEYLVQDPLDERGEIRRLSEYGSRIYAVRILRGR